MSAGKFMLRLLCVLASFEAYKGKSCLVDWDAHGFDSAEYRKLLP